MTELKGRAELLAVNSERPARDEAAPKVFLFAGTRPEAIKMAPVLRAFQHAGRLSAELVAVFQQGDLLRDTLSAMRMEAQHDLAFRFKNHRLFSMASRILDAAGRLLHHTRPTLVLVQGDTTSPVESKVALSAFDSENPQARVADRA